MDNQEATNEALIGGSGLNVGLGLLDQLREEADLCRNETADDIANLLDSAANKIELLQAKLDAWKEIAEYQYGKVREAKYGDMDYPVTGALDAWAAKRHHILMPNV